MRAFSGDKTRATRPREVLSLNKAGMFSVKLWYFFFSVREILESFDYNTTPFIWFCTGFSTKR